MISFFFAWRIAIHFIAVHSKNVQWVLHFVRIFNINFHCVTHTGTKGPLSARAHAKYDSSLFRVASGKKFVHLKKSFPLKWKLPNHCVIIRWARHANLYNVHCSVQRKIIIFVLGYIFGWQNTNTNTLTGSKISSTCPVRVYIIHIQYIYKF